MWRVGRRLEYLHYQCLGTINPEGHELLERIPEGKGKGPVKNLRITNVFGISLVVEENIPIDSKEDYIRN